MMDRHNLDPNDNDLMLMQIEEAPHLELAGVA